MFRINQKSKLFLAVVVFLLLTPLTIYYVIDGVFDLRSRAGNTGTLAEEFKIADLNADNSLGIEDFNIWLSNFRQFRDSPTAYNAMSDLDKNEAIGISDFVLWLNLWRKYKASIAGGGGVTPPVVVNSPLFGTGIDGDISVSADTNINTATISSTRSCADAKSYTVVKFDSDTVVQVNEGVSEACVKTGDEVLIIGLSGTETNVETVGNYETFIVASVAGDKITLNTPRTKPFGAKAMVQRVPQYGNVNIAAGKNLYPSAWDGESGGVVFFRATGTVNVEGIIHADGTGYRGGIKCATASCNPGAGEGLFFLEGNDGKGGRGGDNNSDTYGYAGTFSGGGGDGGYYSTKKPGSGSQLIGATGGGGGGNAVLTSAPANSGPKSFGGGGGGGGNATFGTGGKSVNSSSSNDGVNGSDTSSGAGGNASRYELYADTWYSKTAAGGGGGGAVANIKDTSLLIFGGGGGAGGTSGDSTAHTGSNGGNGGGIVLIAANKITVSGRISANGGDSAAPGSRCAAGGSGAGGSVRLIGNILDLSTNKVTADGGTPSSYGGIGGIGRISIQYMSTFTGSTRPVSTNSKI